jgi:hypothetical protein
MADYKAGLIVKAPKVASRKASEMALEVINATIPTTLGGSADLTGSNLTITKGLQSLTAGDFSGRYVRYGVREFGMSAAMNGIAVHGGFIPYGGTFLVFSDYARPAIRLSAVMGIRVIYVLTHDSSISQCCARPPTSTFSGPATLWRPPSAGSLRSSRVVSRRRCCCRGRTCRRCGLPPTPTFPRAEPM